MRLPLFEKALTAVRFIHDQMDLYSLDNTRESVSMDDLVWTIEQYQEIKIILHYVSFESEYIYSELQIKDSTAEIYVRDSLSHKLRRYAVAKELAHIIMDDDESRSPDGARTLDMLVVKPQSIAEEMPPPLISEGLAQFVALELLYPYKNRKNDKELLENDNITLEQLSDFYEIPVEMIALALHDEVHDLLGRWWGVLVAPVADGSSES